MLQLLNFGLQNKVKQTPGKQAIEFMIFKPNTYVQAKFPPSLKHIYIFIYLCVLGYY